MLDFLFENFEKINLLDSFILYNKCAHNKIYPTSQGDFCPDCGQEIKISWQILRCKCCSTKRKVHSFMKKIVPDEKFCKKCGCSEYYIEIKEKIEFFDYEYAVILKEEVPKLKIKKTLQIWIEEENIREIFIKPKLLPVF